MIGAPPTRTEIYDQITAVIHSVDEHGRAMDRKWGHGRLPKLVSPEWAARFASQAQKFNRAVWGTGTQYGRDHLAEVTKHGDATIRAYAKLDELAVAVGHKPVPPEQWEFDVDGELVILVQDCDRLNQVELGDRRASVWSLDEIVTIVRSQRIELATKLAFPGAEIVETRPGRDVARARQLADDTVPF